MSETANELLRIVAELEADALAESGSAHGNNGVARGMRHAADVLRERARQLVENAPPVKPDAYALRYADGSYWVGIWNDRKIAEDVKAAPGNSRSKMEIVGVVVLPAVNPSEQAITDFYKDRQRQHL